MSDNDFQAQLEGIAEDTRVALETLAKVKAFPAFHESAKKAILGVAEKRIAEFVTRAAGGSTIPEELARVLSEVMEAR